MSGAGIGLTGGEQGGTPWPARLLSGTDRLFVRHAAQSGGVSAVVASAGGTPAWLNYIAGFRRAADAVARSAVEGSAPADEAVYPAAFLYRHHLELTLKALVVAASGLTGANRGEPLGHRLSRLWARARPHVEGAFPGADWSQNAEVTRLLKEMDEVDAGGQSFRYAATLGGDQPVARLGRVDVANLAGVAGRLSDYLLEVLTAYEDEMERRLLEGDEGPGGGSIYDEV